MATNLDVTEKSRTCNILFHSSRMNLPKQANYSKIKQEIRTIARHRLYVWSRVTLNREYILEPTFTEAVLPAFTKVSRKVLASITYVPGTALAKRT